MIASLVITPLVSLVTPAPAAETVARAFGEVPEVESGGPEGLATEGDPA
jgi:hypothetical protein